MAIYVQAKRLNILKTNTRCSTLKSYGNDRPRTFNQWVAGSNPARLTTFMAVVKRLFPFREILDLLERYAATYLPRATLLNCFGSNAQPQGQMNRFITFKRAIYGQADPEIL